MSADPTAAPTAEIENLLAEDRRFPPDPAFTAQANAKAELYAEAEADFEAFWARLARERIDWYEDFHTTLEWDLPFAKWFTGGKLNIAYNCVDRHVERGLGDKVAYHWIGEPGDTRTITYADLQREVSKAANALLELGVTTGDRVAIYMPMIPELPIAMLACARIGAPHTVVFGGFSAEALSGRINDAQAKLVITADGGWRRGKPAPLKPAVDDALTQTQTIEHVLVVRRLGDEVDGGTAMQEGRDVWWHDVVDRQSEEHEPVPLDSEHMLYLLYTSGTTAKPKGIMHTTAGYLLGASFTHEMVFDIKPDDVYWCAADVGWVTGHSYIVYGPLANATTSVLYEGTPDTPDWGRWWQIIEDYKVNILYCAPTAIRAHMKQGAEWAHAHDLSSLRVLGSVGEPINPVAWLWYDKHIGGGTTPIVDTWWQTETGMIMITPLPGRDGHEARQCHLPVPGHRGRRHRPGRQLGPARRRRPAGPEAAVAGHAPRDLRRSRALQGDVLESLPRHVLRGRWGEARCRRVPLAAGSRRRRHERVRPSSLDDRDRERARLPPGRRRGGGRRRTGSDHRRGDQRVRHPAPRKRAGARAGGGAAPACRDEDQPDRQAEDADVRARPAQDEVRQDHAPPAARHRPGPEPG